VGWSFEFEKFAAKVSGSDLPWREKRTLALPRERSLGPSLAQKPRVQQSAARPCASKVSLLYPLSEGLIYSPISFSLNKEGKSNSSQRFFGHFILPESKRSVLYTFALLSVQDFP
jgi:hypothetical protein